MCRSVSVNSGSGVSSCPDVLTISAAPGSRSDNSICCCLNACSYDSTSCVQLTNDELLCCNSKMDMFQITFDHTTSVAAVTVIFTRLIVSEDITVLKVLKSIGHNQ